MTTTNLGLTLPTVNGDADNWGTVLNTALTAIDALFASGGASVVHSKLGLGMSPSNILDITQTQNGVSLIKLLNASTGAAAAARLQLNNSSTALNLFHLGTGFSTTGLNIADSSIIRGDGSSGMSIFTGAAQPLRIGINNSEVARFGADGSLLVGLTASAGTGNIAISGGGITLSNHIGIIKNAFNGNVASGGYIELDTESGGGSFSGILCVSSARAANANVRTNAQYAYSCRNATIDGGATLNAANGPGGGQGFSISLSTTGTFRLSNADANPSVLSMTWIGTNGG